MIVLKSPQEIEKMRASGRIVAEILATLRDKTRAGMKTSQLDAMALEIIKAHDVKSAFLGYYGYPAHICVSINEEVVHGIPGDRVIQEGDVVSVDVGVFKDGYCGDAAVSFGVGDISDEKRLLIESTERSLEEGIKKATPKNRLHDISAAIEAYASAKGYGIVRDYVGHGIGTQMHEDPQVPNFGKPDTGPRLKEGMVLAIEPMLNLGSQEVEVLKDGWTVVTKDRKPSAHFEHTVAITAEGPEILTCLKKSR